MGYRCTHPDDKQVIWNVRPTSNTTGIYLEVTFWCAECGRFGEWYPYARAVAADGKLWTIDFFNGLRLTFSRVSEDRHFAAAPPR